MDLCLPRRLGHRGGGSLGCIENGIVTRSVADKKEGYEASRQEDNAAEKGASNDSSVIYRFGARPCVARYARSSRWLGNSG